METKYWIAIATTVCLIEIWLAYVGYVVLGKPSVDDGFHIMAGLTLAVTVIGFLGLAAWDD